MAVQLIAEIGQNHNGSVDTAIRLIDLCSESGFDAVKFTARNLDAEMSVDMAITPYDSPHSYGATYMEHRRALELPREAFRTLQKHAQSKGLKFGLTLCHPSLVHLAPLCDFVKVASRDLDNVPLLKAIAGRKAIVSTGMKSEADLRRAITILGAPSILHCVSEYPPDHANLLSITYLIRRYPGFDIGYSDHTVGLSAGVAAVALGAKIIEKHVTMDREAKGTDHKGSLGPDGMRRFVRDLRLTEHHLGRACYRPSNPDQTKLGRSWATIRDIAKGERITTSDLHLLSPGDGYTYHELADITGRRAKSDIPANSTIYAHMLL